VTEGTRLVDDVSVVIPTLGRPLLRGCLESIAAGTAWPKELIVVDQGTDPSVDGWVDELRGRGLALHHLRSPQKGIAAATNRGFERVRTTFVATTHDDCRVRTDWLERMAVRVREIDDAILTGRVEPEGKGHVLTVTIAPRPAIYRRPMLDRDVLFPSNMAFPVRLLDRIGYLDEHPSLWLAGEDNEWAYRALRTGVPIVYEPEAVVGHLARHTKSDLTSLYRRYARGQGSFYGKHLRLGDPFIARRALRDVIRAPWLLIRGLATRNPDLVAMGVGEVTGLLPGLLSGLGNAGHAATGQGRGSAGE
jgi:O-antigen biosynthesis protein